MPRLKISAPLAAAAILSQRITVIATSSLPEGKHPVACHRAQSRRSLARCGQSPTPDYAIELAVKLSPGAEQPPVRDKNDHLASMPYQAHVVSQRPVPTPGRIRSASKHSNERLTVSARRHGTCRSSISTASAGMASPPFGPWPSIARSRLTGVPTQPVRLADASRQKRLSGLRSTGEGAAAGKDGPVISRTVPVTVDPARGPAHPCYQWRRHRGLHRAHPCFFRGFLTHPGPAAQALLVTAAVARASHAVARPVNLDPVVTCNTDRLRFESFSGCCGVHARTDILPAGLGNEPAASGTTNVDFNPDMRAALAGAVADRLAAAAARRPGRGYGHHRHHARDGAQGQTPAALA